ncbi:MAG: hypothetical protein NWQ54_04210, partial [Paraglaciecola sp.]|nr:hypothetical protein [Paraglaciecola sp.]
GCLGVMSAISSGCVKTRFSEYRGICPSLRHYNGSEVGFICCDFYTGSAEVYKVWYLALCCS